jgi:hypothetical protein
VMGERERKESDMYTLTHKHAHADETTSKEMSEAENKNILYISLIFIRQV